ncbi:MAG: alpha/beta hydrolase [Flavobacterium sp.]
MKKIAFLLLLFSFASCKTIVISEKWAFKDSKYEFDRYTKYIQNSNYNTAEKEYFTGIVSDIIQTEKIEIINKADFRLNRNFFKANDSIRLEYFEFIPKNYTKTGLFFLGNGSSVIKVSEKLEELSKKTATKIYVLNYRGYGKSDGVPSFKTQFKDNTKFLNFVIERDNMKPKLAIGYSLGSISATYLAIENNFEELYLLAPLSNAEEAIAFLKKQKTSGIKSVLRPFIKISTEQHLLKISNTEQIKNYHGKLVIAHAKDDTVLPYEMGKELYETNQSTNKKLITIEKGGHAAPVYSDNWETIIDLIK